jgi:hypothetical protein
LVVVVGDIDFGSEAELAKVIEAGDAFAGFFGAGQGGQQHGGEDGDDGHDDEQFDEGKGVPGGSSSPATVCLTAFYLIVYFHNHPILGCVWTNSSTRWNCPALQLL